MPANKDTKVKAQNLAGKMIAASERFMDALYELNALVDQKEQAGLNFEDSHFKDSDLRHVDAADMNALSSSTRATFEWLKANFHTTNFQKVRR